MDFTKLSWEKRIKLIEKAAKRFIFISSEQREEFILFAIYKFYCGRKTSLRNLYVDFLRNTIADTRISTYDKKKSILAFNSLYSENLGKKKARKEDFFDYLPNTLTQIQRAVIVLYFWWGFNNTEIGVCIGVCESRISQIKNRAFLKIKKHLMENGLTKKSCILKGL